MESMKHVVVEQDSSVQFQEQIAAAVRRMDVEDLSFVEIDGVTVADAATADQFFQDSRYKHIGAELLGEETVQVFLFVHAD